VSIKKNDTRAPSLNFAAHSAHAHNCARAKYIYAQDEDARVRVSVSKSKEIASASACEAQAQDYFSTHTRPIPSGRDGSQGGTAQPVR